MCHENNVKSNDNSSSSICFMIYLNKLKRMRCPCFPQQFLSVLGPESWTHPQMAASLWHRQIFMDLGNSSRSDSVIVVVGLLPHIELLILVFELHLGVSWVVQHRTTVQPSKISCRTKKIIIIIFQYTEQGRFYFHDTKQRPPCTNKEIV